MTNCKALYLEVIPTEVWKLESVQDILLQF